jgi:hypothetical protein
MKSYLVLHKPRGMGVTVDKITVIDAFSCNGSLVEAITIVCRKELRGDYDKHGPGAFTVIPDDDWITTSALTYRERVES